MLIYLVASSLSSGRAYALAQGWIQIAASRFITVPVVKGVGKSDIRLVCHFRELLPIPSGIKIIRGPSWDLHHDREKIEAFVADGGAAFVDPPPAEEG